MPIPSSFPPKYAVLLHSPAQGFTALSENHISHAAFIMIISIVNL
jgi:hypothetical protein